MQFRAGGNVEKVGRVAMGCVTIITRGGLNSRVHYAAISIWNSQVKFKPQPGSFSSRQKVIYVKMH